MRSPTRDDGVAAGLAALAAAVHVGGTALADRPLDLDLSLLFVGLPVLLAVAAAAAVLGRERRPLQAACLWAWLMVLFTLPAGGLGLFWLPAAALLTVALTRAGLSSDRRAAG